MQMLPKKSVKFAEKSTNCTEKCENYTEISLIFTGKKELLM